MSSVLTPTGMLSFPELFAAKPQAPGAEPRFSLNLILDAAAQKTPEWLAVRKLAAEAINDFFGAGKAQDAEWMRKNKVRLPWRPASDRDYTGYDVENGLFISPWSKNKPGVVNGARQDILVPSDVWSGQLARCTVHAFAYDTSGNKGVGFNLNNVQIVKADMPRLDGRKAAKDEFGEVAGAGGGSLDDEIPF